MNMGYLSLIDVKNALCIPQDIDVLVIGWCYFITLQNGHLCVEKSMH
jgi:hypothetical protein